MGSFISLFYITEISFLEIVFFIIHRMTLILHASQTCTLADLIVVRILLCNYALFDFGLNFGIETAEEPGV